MMMDPEMDIKKITEMIGSRKQSIERNFEGSLEYMKRHKKMLELGVDGFKTYARKLERDFYSAECRNGLQVSLSPALAGMLNVYRTSPLCRPTWAECLYERLIKERYVVEFPKYLDANIEIAMGRALTSREHEIVHMRFGATTSRPMTLEEVGKELNLTRERVRHVEEKALRKLRHPSRLKIIKCESVWTEEIEKQEEVGREIRRKVEIEMGGETAGVALQNLGRRSFETIVDILRGLDLITPGDIWEQFLENF